MRVELRSTVARKYTCLAVFAMLALTISCSESPKSPAFVAQIPREAVSDKDAQTIAVDAYIYFYPLITMDITRRVSVNTDPSKKAGFGPAGEFHHIREYPPVTFREVVRPNFDTLYSLAWVDVAKDPMILSVPDTDGRYYVLPIYDMWTDAFAALGKRTSGTKAGNFAIVSRGWRGTLPAGIERIEAPTSTCWIIARTQTNGPSDYDAVHKVQDGYKLTPLSHWSKDYKPSPVAQDPNVDINTPPLEQVNNMPADKYFSYAAELMKTTPPHLTDWSILERMKGVGIVPGQSFDFAHADPLVQRALEHAPQEGLKLMKAKLPTMARIVNGWQMNTDSIGVYGNYYLKRAIVALVGLGANSPEDAVYPLNVADGDGKPVDGSHKYALHLAKEDLPPVDAFWSITMYDRDGFQTANPINRYAIGDRDQLKYNSDGSLDIYIQHDRPDASKESNWLPAPMGPLGITMRLYAPHAEVIDGRWNPPPIKRVS